MQEESWSSEHLLDIVAKSTDNSHLIQMLKTFSDAHHLKIVTEELDSPEKTLMIELDGPGVLILSDNSSEQNIFSTSSYAENPLKYGKDATRDIMTQLAAYARTVPDLEVTVNY